VVPAVSDAVTGASGAVSGAGAGVRGWFADIGRAVGSIFEGLAVTMSWMFRRPWTIQYPDKIEKPVQEMLPDTWRGVLEVDLGRCVGDLLCERACPIGCIAMKVEKNAATGVREITKFDIDIGRCMYCGLCQEACKFGALCHTTQFEACASSADGLVLHFAKDPVPVSRHKAGEGPARQPPGSILPSVIAPCYGRKPWSPPRVPAAAEPGIGAVPPAVPAPAPAEEAPAEEKKA
jgi:formate hydrogenlyase subunit 6/NADH:ubiquinone oxidoreductase subunit I